VDNKTLLRVADNVRILSAAMVEKAGSGHPGGAMGAAEFISVLFGEVLEYDPADPHWIARDRYFQDPGHMSPMLYAALALTGKLSMDDLQGFRQLGTHTSGHPELDVMRGIENTSGPLGMGHAIGVGATIAEEFLVNRFGSHLAHKTYCLISDGGVQEEIAYGVGRLAGHLKLSNLIMYYDANDIQLSCATEDVLDIQVIADMYRAWRWKVLEVDGHNVDQIRGALQTAKAETECPVLIIGRSKIGRGAVTAEGDSFEGQLSTHGQPLSKAGADIAKTIANLGGDPENPWQVFPEVADAFAQREKELTASATTRREEFAAWQKAEPQKAEVLNSWLAGKAPVMDFAAIAAGQKPQDPTRNHSGVVLKELAGVGNVICSSADLANSDQTQKFLNETGIFKPGDFSGAFMQLGVSELTMAAACNGIALHGGVIPVCGTFFVFSDYMKPAIRMAALMELPVNYVWTHDSFRVGEDGPTHQPVEHELQIRLVESMTNLKGKPGMLVLRPADGWETTRAWKMALENRESPTGLILTRQVVDQLPAAEGTDLWQRSEGCEKGAYIVSDNTPEGANTDLYMVGNGSDVKLCDDVAEKLRAEGKNVRVVSMISTNLFLRQTDEYQRSILPVAGPIFCVSSGLSAVFAEIQGPLGQSFGLNRFGTSAPFQVLEDFFGYTPEKLYQVVETYLGEYPKKLQALRDLVH